MTVKNLDKKQASMTAQRMLGLEIISSKDNSLEFKKKKFYHFDNSVVEKAKEKSVMKRSNEVSSSEYRRMSVPRFSRSSSFGDSTTAVKVFVEKRAKQLQKKEISIKSYLFFFNKKIK